MHTWRYGATITEHGYNSRLLFQYKVLNDIAQYATANDIKHIFFLGDLFHTYSQVPTQVLSLAHNVFWWWKNQFNLDAYFLVGNHDMLDKKQGKIHSIGWLREYGTVIEEPCTFQVAGQTFHAMPYTEDAEKLHDFLQETPNGAIILLHQGVVGVPMGSGFVIDEILHPDLIPEQCKHLFTGHYHMHKKVNDKLTIVGSTMQLTWADVGDARGWVVYDTDTNEVEHVQSNAPEFRVFDMNDVSYLPGGLPPHMPVQNNFIRVVNWKGDRDELRETLKSQGAASVEFELDESIKPGTNLFKKADFSIEPIVKQYDEMEMPKRRKEIGKQIRDFSYETNKI